MNNNIKNIVSLNHNIVFEENGYAELNLFLKNTKFSKIFIITDTNSNEFCLQLFLQNLETELTIEIIEFENGEENKNIDTCVQIWEALTELGADRKSLIINLGGGVVTDLGGFVASTFKRGIDFVHVPTTLLAMVDAAIGGKNGVDLGNLKNQVGVINNPKMVLVDSIFLQTLPQNQLLSGLAEMLKHGLIFDKNYWNKLNQLSNLNYNDFSELIFESIEIKNNIVQQDPTENGIRKALNFGHTLGHAIESYFLENQNKQTLLHGEAIAIGMVLEAFLSLEIKLITLEEYLEIKTFLKKTYPFVEFLKEDLNPILELLIHDKKNEYGNIQFALLNGIGKTKLDQIITNNMIISAFEDYKNLY